MREAAAGIADAGVDAGPLGILAGAGAFPIEIAAAVSRRGRAVHIVAIDGFAEPDTARYPHDRVGLGQVARMLRCFRRAGCREIMIAGGLRRPDLTRLKPDWGLIRHLPTLLSLTRGGDDSVLRHVVRFFEQQGFMVRGAADVASELLAPSGPIGALAPTAGQLTAVARAARAIQVLGAFDVGQAAVATADRVIAVETVRGTDALLASLLEPEVAGSAQGGVLVKLAKPGQEMRVDLPAVGPRTIEGAVASGLCGIAVGAGKAVVLERPKLVAQSDAAGLFLYGLAKATAEDVPPVTAPLDPHGMLPLAVLARRAPTPSERSDVYIGRQLAHVLAQENLGRAAIIAGRHVLAIATDLNIPAMLRQVGRDSQWGRRAFKSRIGTLVIDIGAAGDADAVSERLLSLAVFAAAKEVRLAGVAVLGARIPDERREEVIGWANDARLFLLAEEAAHA